MSTSPSPPATVLVTGGAGYIGSHAVLALRDARRRVVVIDDLSTGFAWALPDDVPLIEGDVADAALVAGVLADHRVDAVMHFAGSIIVPESVADPLKYYRNNTAASRSLIETVLASPWRSADMHRVAAEIYQASGMATEAAEQDRLAKAINPLA
jgi:UDP-glucose 4-epimerase